MTAPTILDTLDPELLAKVATRRDALAGAASRLGIAALASMPIALGVMAKSAFAQGATLPQGIIDVLNFALTLEYLEDEFYDRGLAAGTLIPTAARTVFQQISKHEQSHVTLLQGVLGASAVVKPTFDFTARGAFPDVFTSYTTFLALAQGFEDTGVRAYKGQAANLISNNDILTTALRIHSVEGRHAAKVRRLRGQKGWITGSTTDVPALAASYAGEDAVNGSASGNAGTEAFDEPLTKDAVLAIVGPFLA